ncbi:phospholipase A2 A2-actitoxin-Cgg2a-like [Dendronephthya gigantea]|uniref:phospholipase A2 A2-actitoxin-Cgg2a-like n=1 Tax=Dendronephthya gigantea TaxID=151771 RepID=UPI00106AF114|nr:phospholipase A2 A2-actitoxin-Cgg2a-like [Dendronephthya gigantea]
MIWSVSYFLVILTVINTLDGKAVDSINNQKRGLYFGHMISCETGRSAVDYLDYGCFCGLGGRGTPVDELDTCCHTHDQCYGDLLDSVCSLSHSIYSITYKYHGCSDCAEPHEYSWWDSFGYESVACRKALCDCDAAAAKCFKKSHFNDEFKHYDYDKC